MIIIHGWLILDEIGGTEEGIGQGILKFLNQEVSFIKFDNNIDQDKLLFSLFLDFRTITFAVKALTLLMLVTSSCCRNYSIHMVLINKYYLCFL